MVKQLSRIGFLEPHKTLFLLCDIQEKFRPGMKYFAPMVANANKLVQAGKILNVPLIATEHYPLKLGKIVQELDVSHAKAILSKTRFSMVVPELLAKIHDLYCGKLESIVLFGLEAHICLEQTAMDLIAHGYNIHVAADACMSRRLDDRAIALERLRQLGCQITTSESVIFKLMQDKEHPKFNKIRHLVNEMSADTGLEAKL